MVIQDVVTCFAGSSCYGCVDAGWPEGSARGNVRVTFSCQRIQKKILDLVKDEPELLAAFFIRMDEERWLIEQFWKDTTQLPWLGQYQNRPYRAAVTHLHLVCFADALPTRLCLQRAGAQGQWHSQKAAVLSTTAAQGQRRGLLRNREPTFAVLARQIPP